MKKTLLIVVLGAALASCAPTPSVQSNIYAYNYSLRAPTVDTALRYEDERINIMFAITATEINFNLKNKANDPLKIVWDDASLVIFGKAGKVMHKGVKYTERNNAQTSTTIPPGASLEDLVIPTENVSYREGYYGRYASVPGGWTTQEIFLNRDYKKEVNKKLIEGVVGQELTLYLPVRDMAGKEVGYSFVFKVDSVECSSCKPGYMPAATTRSKFAKPPYNPKKKKSTGAKDQ